MHDIYIRVSQLGERSEDEATERYEAECRAWADRHAIDIDEVEIDADVSGATAVAKRKLERLIQKVEAGESEGILTPYVDRFGRSLTESALAYNRIREAGGQLVCVRDGADSARDGDKLIFQIRAAVAEDFLGRVKDNFLASVNGAAAKGIYLAARAPFGGFKDAEGRLVWDEKLTPIVAELYSRKSAGENLAQLRRWLRERGHEFSKSGIRGILSNRAYRGEMQVQTAVKGAPRTVPHTAGPILSEAQWEAAQARQEYVPRNGASADAVLRGLVHCATCGKRAQVSFSGKPAARRAHYTCTSEGCKAHASIRAAKLDEYVGRLLWEAFEADDPHVLATAAGSVRYADALAEVEHARSDLAEYRDSIEIQRAIGAAEFAKGLKARKLALEDARRGASKLRPRNGEVKPPVWDDDDPAETHAVAQSYIERIIVKPAHAGRRGRAAQPAAERVEVYWIGASVPYTLAGD